MIQILLLKSIFMSKARGISDDNNPYVESMKENILDAAAEGYLSRSWCSYFGGPDDFERILRAARIVQHELDVGWTSEEDEEEDELCIDFTWADSGTKRLVSGMIESDDDEEDDEDDGMPKCPDCNSSEDVEGPDEDGDYKCTDDNCSDDYFQPKPKCPDCGSSEDVEGPDEDGDYKCTDDDCSDDYFK